MNEIEKQWVDARLEAAEARTQARLASIEADIRIMTNTLSGIHSELSIIRAGQAETKALK